jgi:Tfp pilus assembly protein PilO
MANRKKQISTALLQFYDKPIAKVSVELFMTISTVIIFAVFAIRPTLLTMSDLIKELNDKKELNALLKEKVASLQSAQNEYLAAQDRLGVLDEAIPSTPKFEEAVLIIEKIASDNKLLISSMDAKEVPKEPDDKVDIDAQKRVSRPILVTVTGDYPTIRHFIEDLRNSQRTLIVSSVIFTTYEDEGGKKLRATITVEVQYFGLDNQKAADTTGKTTP